MENVTIRKNPMESRIKFFYKEGIKSRYYNFFTTDEAIFDFREKALALFLKYERLQPNTDQEPWFAFIKSNPGSFGFESGEVTSDFLCRFHFDEKEVYKVDRVTRDGAYLKTNTGFNSFFFAKENLIYIYFDFDGWNWF